MVINIVWLLPEIAITVSACLLLMIDSFLGKYKDHASYGLSLLTAILLVIIGNYLIELPQVDKLAIVLKATLAIMLLVVLLYSKIYLQKRNLFRADFFALILFSVLGLMILISANTFLLLYLGLELFALPLYALIAMQKENKNCVEAAIKYFIMGALASGLLLYGISLVYGVTGSFDFATIYDKLLLKKNHLTLEFGMIFILAGLAFKLGAVPFHMWVPDIYTGSPTALTLFLGTIPKLAAFAMAYRLLAQVFANLADSWQLLLAIMAGLSLVLGNLIAIVQTNIKRMLAYSTIAHVGFILLGLIAAGSSQDYTAAMFYVIIYSLMALGAFGVIIVISGKGFEADNIADFSGLHQRHPWLALLMLILMFSMAGIPPTVGFYAKFLVLQALIQANYIGLAVVGLLFSVVGAFYYLRIIKLMYFDSPNADINDFQGGMSLTGKVIIAINGILMILLGVYPLPLLQLCTKALYL